MAAGLGFKTFATGEVLSAANVNGYLMQGILVFATEAARNAAITVPAEGQFAFTKDTNSTWYYDGAAWVASGASGDVTGITVSNGIAGTSLTGPVPALTLATTAKGDLLAGTGSNTAQALTVGANDTVLTADSTTATGLKWAAAAGGATWSLLNSGGTALTGAQTVTVSGISGADKIMVLVSGASANSTANTNIELRINGDTASNYYYYGFNITAAASYAATIFGTRASAQSSAPFAQMSTSNTSGVSGYALISGCNSSGVKVFNMAGGATAAGGNNQMVFSGGGYWNSSSTVTSISIYSNYLDLDGGTVFIYTSA